jgi:hypothetical protein
MGGIKINGIVKKIISSMDLGLFKNKILVLFLKPPI